MTMTNSSVSYLKHTGKIYIETYIEIEDLLNEIPIVKAVEHYGNELLEHIDDDAIREYVKNWSFDDAKSE